MKLSRVGGTDAHYAPQIGYGYTVIEAEEPSIEAVAKAIVDGHCQAFGQAVPIILNMKQSYWRLNRLVKKFANRT